MTEETSHYPFSHLIGAVIVLRDLQTNQSIQQPPWAYPEKLKSGLGNKGKELIDL